MDTINTAVAAAATLFPVLKNKDMSGKELVGYTVLSIARTDGKKGKSDTCIQVPTVSDSLATVIYNDPVGNAWFRSQIDTVRSKLASETNKAGGVITSVTIGVDALLAAMAVQEAAARISKESIGVWFSTCIAPLVSAALTAKGIPDGVHAKILDGFSGSFQRLANSEVTMPASETDGLCKALALVGEDSEVNEDVMTEKVATRLQACIERSAVVGSGSYL